MKIEDAVYYIDIIYEAYEATKEELEAWATIRNYIKEAEKPAHNSSTTPASKQARAD
jgi:hypothetical protein